MTKTALCIASRGKNPRYCVVNSSRVQQHVNFLIIVCLCYYLAVEKRIESASSRLARRMYRRSGIQSRRSLSRRRRPLYTVPRITRFPLTELAGATCSRNLPGRSSIATWTKNIPAHSGRHFSGGHISSDGSGLALQKCGCNAPKPWQSSRSTVATGSATVDEFAGAVLDRNRGCNCTPDFGFAPPVLRTTK